MKNIFDHEVMEEIINRIHNLTPFSERYWGKMEVAQMLAHCSSSLQFATGERKPKRILLILGATVGSIFKSIYYDDKPFKKNRPTSRESIIADRRDFYKEKVLLIDKVTQLVREADKCEKHPHPYFGYLTLNQWGTGI